jgi:putative RNA 2'-phosphotransferase
MQPGGNLGPRKRPQPRIQAAAARSGDERLGRFLAFVLRHHPEKLRLTLDERASADIETVAKALNKRPGFEAVTRKQIERFVESAISAHRFEINGNRIRARYGHSLPQPIVYEQAEPPAVLFYGTIAENAQVSLKEGLKIIKKRLVHLSTDITSARQVGLRRTPQPVILKVDTVKAAKAGVVFYKAGPAVWLSDAIPPACISKMA